MRVPVHALTCGTLGVLFVSPAACSSACKKHIRGRHRCNDDCRRTVDTLIVRAGSVLHITEEPVVDARHRVEARRKEEAKAAKQQRYAV